MTFFKGRKWELGWVELSVDEWWFYMKAMQGEGKTSDILLYRDRESVHLLPFHVSSWYAIMLSLHSQPRATISWSKCNIHFRYRHDRWGEVTSFIFLRMKYLVLDFKGPKSSLTLKQVFIDLVWGFFFNTDKINISGESFLRIVTIAVI